MKKYFFPAFILIVCVLVLSGDKSRSSIFDFNSESSEVRLAVIGDFGRPTFQAWSVSRLVSSWNVEAVITVGDNNYPTGDAKTFNRNVMFYYGKWIKVEKFYPALGNHDWGYPWDAGWKADEIPQFEFLPYLLDIPPGNGRYYDVMFGDIVHVFVIDSDAREPDGRSEDSVQGRWLETELLSSIAEYKLVFMHEPPFSSCMFGDNYLLDWPYKEWGADVVFAGHCHNYERLVINGFPYIINGLGGSLDISTFEKINFGSQVRYLDEHGAILITADDERLGIYFITTNGEVVDKYLIFGNR